MRRAATIFVLTLLALVAFVAGFAYRKAQRVLSAPYLGEQLDRRLADATDGVYRLRLGETTLDLLHGTFVASDFAIAPDSLALERQRAAGSLGDMHTSLSAASLRLDHVDLWKLWRGRVHVGSATLDHPVIQVYLDRKASSDVSPRPARMPHQLLRKIPRPFHIDVFVIKDGSVSYSELAKDGRRPGTIHFEEVNATMRGITNERVAASMPCRIDLHMLLAGASRTDVTLDYDLAAPDLLLRYRGTIGRAPATSFNEILVDLQGLRVTSGVLDSTWFDFDVRDDQATGRVQVLYHDLRSEIVDKVTRDTGVGEKLKTFVNNTFVVTAANPAAPDKPPVVVPVHQMRVPKDNLFRFLWVIVREGVYQTLGIKKQAS